MKPNGEYLNILKKRGRESRAYKKYQLFGLEISEILGDTRHKALYIKLAKEGDAEELLALAKRVAERKGIRNKGAYFMRIVSSKNYEK